MGGRVVTWEVEVCVVGRVEKNRGATGWNILRERGCMGDEFGPRVVEESNIFGPGDSWAELYGLIKSWVVF
jgi:hypothetical protein